MKSIQFYLSPSAGKQLIGKAIAALPDIQAALKEHTVVIIAGTTNASVAYELLKQIGDTDGFSHKNFFRGMTVPQGTNLKSDFIGDVVIEKGKWLRGKTIFDVADSLSNNDIILKGANAVQLEDRESGVLLGNSQVGTALPILSAVYGRRAKLYVPVGTEKRVSGKLFQLSAIVNDTEAEGLRLLPLPGEIITELDSISILSNAKAYLIGGGGVLGAEGGSYYMAKGSDDELNILMEILETVKNEPPFQLN